MNVKKYGLYLFYAPGVKLAQEGLGRHLLEFLKATKNPSYNIEFIIACPSWMLKMLEELLHSDGLKLKDFTILCPKKQPILLQIHAFLLSRKKKYTGGKFFSNLKNSIKVKLHNTFDEFQNKIAATRNIWLLLFITIISMPFLFLALVALGLYKILQLVRHICIEITAKMFNHKLLNKTKIKFNAAVFNPKNLPILTNFYQKIENEEANAVLKMINAYKDVNAWYCPTAFWSSFLGIEKPKLMCVPDVVLSNFPIGFCGIGGDRFLNSFNQISENIKKTHYFVTYSNDVKYSTLVNKYNIDPNNIFNIHHGANCLDELIFIADKNYAGDSKKNLQTTTLCKNIFINCASKVMHNFSNKDVKFIFYASQFRPNKNVITLLKAYNYLLKQRYIQHKLILTGNIDVLPEIKAFIKDNNLYNDVICLHGISAQELASCYYLADLSVNPSLSEGGCPFTFTESLSVDTPVVMADIAVTREVLNNDDMNQYTFFNPYDYKDMANRIEWALNNTEFLLSQQKPFFNEIKKRTWDNVVNDYIKVLDNISLTNQNQNIN